MKYLKSLFLQNSRSYSTRYQKFKSLISPSTHESFESSLNEIIDDVSKKKSYLSLAGIKDHIMKAAEYNRKIGYNPSGIIMLHSYDILKKTSLSLDVKYQAFVLAWAIEMLHSYNILGDKQTLPKSEMVMMSGVAGVLRSFIYDMIEENCDAHLYKDILQFFDKGFLYTAIGSYLDNYIKNKGKADKFADFNSKTYETLCEYRTAYNTFKLPFLIASHITKKSDKVVNDTFEKIGSDLSKLYQVQGEFEDCFGYESKEIRSAGTDIQKGKCTWLAVSALQRCTAPQRIVFNACYGSNEPAHVERIKLLYEQLKIPQLYRAEEGALCESIMQRAESIEGAGIPLAMFSKLLDAMHQEKKIDVNCK